MYYEHMIQKYFHIYFWGLEEDTYQCKVQLCGFPALDEVQEGERVPKQEWSLWDPEITRRSRVLIPASPSSDADSMDGNIDSESLWLRIFIKSLKAVTV